MKLAYAVTNTGDRTGRMIIRLLRAIHLDLASFPEATSSLISFLCAICGIFILSSVFVVTKRGESF